MMENLIKNKKINTHARSIIDKNPKLLDLVMSKTRWMDITSSLMRRLIVIRDELTSLPLCEYCGINSVRFVKTGTSEKLSNTCSTKCRCKLALPKSHLNRDPDWTKNLAEALNKKDDYGVSPAMRAGKNSNSTKKARGYIPSATHLHTEEVRKKIANSLKHSEKFKLSAGAFWKKATAEDIQNMSNKIRLTREQTGDWLPIDRMSEFTLYNRLVRMITRKQSITHLIGFENRGRGKMHLDHIVSVKYGFMNNLPAEIIGSIHNLRFISEFENCSKQAKTVQSDVKTLLEYFNSYS